MVCIRCQKRPAIIFIQRMDNGQMKQEGYCLHCARELHIKPVDDLMKQFGMSDQDLDNICLLYTSPSPRDGLLSRMPSSA